MPRRSTGSPPTPRRRRTALPSTGERVRRVVAAGRAEPGGPIERTVAAVLAGVTDEKGRALYASDLAEYLAWCARRRPRTAPLRATAADLAAYVRRLERRRLGPRGLAGATLRRKTAVVRAFYSRAIAARRHDGPNPVPRLRDLPPPLPVEPPLGTGEASRLLAAVTRATGASDPRRALRAQRDRLAITLALYLGLRSGALLALRAGDLDHDAATLLVRGTRATVTELPIPPALAACINTYRAATAAAGIVLADDEPLLFGIDPAGRPSGPDGRPAPMVPSTLYRVVHAALGEVGRTGRRTGPHALRRASAALLYGATGDLALVQAHLGVASSVTALAYLELPDVGSRSTLERFPLPLPAGE